MGPRQLRRGERTADLEAARRDLEQASSTLERRVEQGVAALRDADRMAAYGHQVAGVAHELRHPLSAVQTAAHLLHNARRHAGASRVVVRAELAEAGDGEAAVLRLSVADDGVGIPVSRQATLLEPFVSGSGGTGLGLAIARRIAETHGGSIRVESDVGRGSTFVVELPPA